MRKILSRINVVACLLITQTAFSQLSIKDSLERQLPNSKGVQKIDLLLQLADMYIASDLSQSFQYSRQAVEESSLLNDNQWIGKSYKMLSICYSEKGNHDSSDYFFRQVFKYIPDDPSTYFFMRQNEWFN